MLNDKQKQNAAANTVFAVAVVLILAIPVRLGGCLIQIVSAKYAAEAGATNSPNDPNNVEKFLEKSKQLAEQLKEKNLFAPPPPKECPIKEVRGILGKEALIDGKWYKAGDKVEDANIIAIEPTCVKVVWNGQEKTFAPLSASGAATTPSAGKAEPTKEAQKKEGPVAAGQGEEVAQVETSSEEDPLAWMGVKLSAELRAKFLEKWNQMSDEEKAQVKEQWNQMSQEQKEQMVEMMEQNIDSI